LHILFITHYYEPDSGAASVRLSRLAKLLHQRGHQVTVLTTMPHYPQGRIQDAYRGQLVTDENRAGIRVLQVWLWTTPKNNMILRLIGQLSFLLACALRGIFISRPDVIFIENQPVFTALAGWFLTRIKRVPFLANVSDFWPEYLVAVAVVSEQSLVYKAFAALVNRIQRDAAAIAVLHPPLIESIEKRIGPTRNAQVIYNAVDLERFHPQVDTTEFRQQYDLGTQRLITFTGTFGTHIDIDTMLNVAAYFNWREDVRFVFIGTGNQRERLGERLQSGDLSRSKWIGWLDHSEMPAAWAASYLNYWAIHDLDVYRYSIQSKFYEALASGTPPVIAIEGLTTDILERADAGITVPFGDQEALIAAIERLLDDETERNRLSANGRAYAEANFDPESVADAYESLLQSIAGKPQTIMTEA